MESCGGVSKVMLSLCLLNISKRIQLEIRQARIIIHTHIFLLAELPELFRDLLPEWLLLLLLLLLLLYLILIGF